MSKSLEEYLRLCFLYGTKEQLNTAKTDNLMNDNLMNDEVRIYEPFKDIIKDGLLLLLAGLLDNNPIDIDINKKIKMASKKQKEKEYIYGYTVKLKMEWSVLEDKDCERAIPDGGFNEIGLKMTNRARVAQINEERSKCKHGDTVVASISNLFKRKGGGRKTKRRNPRRTKRRPKHRRTRKEKRARK
jgi:hypothetical protein